MGDQKISREKNPAASHRQSRRLPLSEQAQQHLGPHHEQQQGENLL
jgi:hypothetical protein